MTSSRQAAPLEIVLFGGEPLLEFPLMKETAAYARHRASELGKEISFSVTTNGTIMNEEIASFGREYNFNFLLSIDGDRIAHDLHRKTAGGYGTWDTVMGENLDVLRSIQGWLGARVTVNPDTAGRLSSGVRELFGRGINQFLIGPNMNTVWQIEDLELYAYEMRKVYDFYACAKGDGAPIRVTNFEDTLGGLQSKYCSGWGCSAGKNRVAISTSGDIYPCARFVNGEDRMQRYKLGTVYDGLTELKPRLELLHDSDRNRSKCLSCSYHEYCAGACYGANLGMCGSVFDPNPIDCFTSKAMVELMRSIENERQEPTNSANS